MTLTVVLYVLMSFLIGKQGIIVGVGVERDERHPILLSSILSSRVLEAGKSILCEFNLGRRPLLFARCDGRVDENLKATDVGENPD